MQTVIYPSPVFGPVRSRRLGVSLGINLMPADGKICTFDCLYCECGLNNERKPLSGRPTRQQVRECLEEKLQCMSNEGPAPDVLTFAGNGEPTAHPEFPEIVNDVISLRNRYFPGARVSVLSNATRIGIPAVRSALLKVDDNIQKLDAADIGYIQKLDRPVGSYDLQTTIGHLKSFNGHVIIQTMFLSGTVGGSDMDNTSDTYVLPWLDALRTICPEKVMIYTIARNTPVDGLVKASPSVLDSIAERVRQSGLMVSVSY